MERWSLVCKDRRGLPQDMHMKEGRERSAGNGRGREEGKVGEGE